MADMTIDVALKTNTRQLKSDIQKALKQPIGCLLNILGIVMKLAYHSVFHLSAKPLLQALRTGSGCLCVALGL